MRRSRIWMGVGLLAVLALGAVGLSLRPDGGPVAVEQALAQPAGLAPVVAPSIAASADPVTAPEVGALVVTSAVGDLPVYDAPDGAVTEILSATATYGSPRTMLAVGDGAAVAGWIRVQLPERWGQTYGWVRESDVSTHSTFKRIDVYLDEHEVDVSDGGQVVLTTSVAVGAPNTPTPLGLAYVTEVIDLTAAPGGVYGPYILALSRYSDAFASFYGGRPQLALHGTNKPGSIGTSGSNGCVRLPNDTIATLAPMVELGTPVYVHQSRTQG